MKAAERGFVLDASALLAMLNSEPGGDLVADALAVSSISAVNWSEVLQKSAERAIDTSTLADDLRSFPSTARLPPLSPPCGWPVFDRSPWQTEHASPRRAWRASRYSLRTVRGRRSTRTCAFS